MGCISNAIEEAAELVEARILKLIKQTVTTGNMLPKQDDSESCSVFNGKDGSGE